MGVAMSVDIVVSVLVVLELSKVDAEGVESAHAVLSLSAIVLGASRAGEYGREQSSMKRERRWAAGGEAMAIVVV